MYSNEPDFRVNSRADSIRSAVIGTTHHRCVYFVSMKSAAALALIPATLIVAITLTYRLEALGLQRIKTAVIRFIPTAFEAVNMMEEGRRSS